MECIMFASGSKGNCIYIGNENDAIVIDAGIGYMKRILEEHKINTGNIRALCVTHEHSDHVRSAKAFVKSVNVPVFATGGTLDEMVRQNLVSTSTKLVRMHDDISVAAGDLSITSFRVYHDAMEPCGFVVDDGVSKIGVCLDTHLVSKEMFSALASCDGVILESNYSELAMRYDKFPVCEVCRSCGAECRGNCHVTRLYPRYLKDRIIESGHLSNEYAAEVIEDLAPEVGVIALAHLSENYNRPNIARKLAEDAAEGSDCAIYVSDQLPNYREKRMVRFSI